MRPSEDNRHGHQWQRKKDRKCDGISNQGPPSQMRAADAPNISTTDSTTGAIKNSSTALGAATINQKRTRPHQHTGPHGPVSSLQTTM